MRGVNSQLLHLPRRLSILLCTFLFVVCLCRAAADDKTVQVVVGVTECADCNDLNIKASQAFSGLRVTIDCKLKNGEVKRRGSGEVDSEGKFKVSVSVKDGKLDNEECYAQLHSASATPCPAHDSLQAHKIVYKQPAVLKSGEHGKVVAHVFGPAENVKFTSALCASAFLWPFFKYPHLPKIKHPWFSHPPLPKFPFPPIYKKPLPPPLHKPKPLPPLVPPVITKPLPPPVVPIYKPKPNPIPKPPVIVKKPLPPPVPAVYKPNPKPKPPVYKPPVVVKKPCPPPVPIYKPKPKPPAVVVKKPLPPPVVPIYKPKPNPPVVTKPLPPVPIYNKKPLPPPIFPFKKPPCPPLPQLPPLPKFPPKVFPPHPIFGYVPPLPPHLPIP